VKNSKPFYFLFLLLTASITAQLQTAISGKILGHGKEPIASASITIKNTGQGTSSDSSGAFSLTTTLKESVILRVTSVGYISREIKVTASDSFPIVIVLEEQHKSLGEVVVVGAGAFEASDKAKGASLTPMDAVTVAGNGGDIANALRVLPGAQQIGETEGLFVRGGTGEEAKQFVDGILLRNPNFSRVPGLPQPARLNPFLFKGILFSTGGYSALYGQAMSSALILETVDLPDESSAGLHIFPMSVGAGFQKLAKDKRSSYGVNTRYGNSKFYNRIIDAKPDFFFGPTYMAADANFRIRTSKTGMLKFYTNYGYSHTGVRNPDVDSADLLSSFEIKGTNFYTNLSYRELLGRNWKIDAAVAYNYSKENIGTRLLDDEKRPVSIPQYPYDQKNKKIGIQSDFGQARVVMSKMLGRRQTLRFGTEYFYSNDHHRNEDSLAVLADDLIAAFVESDVYIARNIAAKVGIRTEYSSLLNQAVVAPRISVAYRFIDGGQINMAYGIFYQKPENIYLVQNGGLDFSRSQHYILNYQKKLGNRLFRVEGYYKQYKSLITTTANTSNDGDGYAKGIELFFRDKKTIRNLDYWITYTYLDTKRRFLDYPVSLHPNFSTPHTASIALKRYFQDINLSANLSYTLATGRPYYNIQANAAGKPYVFDEGTTNTYSGMNLSFAYLFSMFKGWKNKDFSGIGFGMNNVFGRKQIFGYKYSHNGLNKLPVTQPAARTFYLGIFMSFGIDRRDDFINDNL
jgi:vitamin B12 transporter